MKIKLINYSFVFEMLWFLPFEEQTCTSYISWGLPWPGLSSLLFGSIFLGFSSRAVGVENNFFFPYREEILPVTRNCKESISREKWFKRANSVFTWFQLSFKFLYSSWQKLYLLVQTSNPVDSIGHCYGFLPLDLGEEWNEMVGREDLKDFQMIGYVVKF